MLETGAHQLFRLLISSQRNVNVAAVAPALASSRRIAVINAITSTILATGLAIDKVIRVWLAALITLLAFEDTSIHVRPATPRHSQAHDVAAHVDFARYVSRSIVARGKLAPCVIDLAISAQMGSMVVQSGPSATHTIFERNCDFVADVG